MKNARQTPSLLEWNSRQFANPNGDIITSTDGTRAFVPKRLPPRIAVDNELFSLAIEAERAVAELNGASGSLDNPYILVRAHLKKEAVLSSRIEGTLASIKDLNMHEAIGGIEASRIESIRLHEVLNYVKSLDMAWDMIDKGMPIDTLMICSMHKMLLQGVRGEYATPGQLRESQNYIVRNNTFGKRTVTYVPPPPDMVPGMLHEICEFAAETHKTFMTPLIESALIHYQFEALHPFVDGNGRVGRILIPLLLHKREWLRQPVLYVGAYFEANRDEYYDRLRQVTEESRWSEWIKMFLRAYSAQATNAIAIIRSLEELRSKYTLILKNTKSGANSLHLMQELFSNPYMTIPRAATLLKVTYPTAKSTVMEMIHVGILLPTDTRHRSKVYLAQEIEDTLYSE